ncbi:MAG TPA: SDR family oxidoreductase [Acidimicrobiia bacterium]|nr:SDR family oxidoreductase [Acidimicrobiia bacterium]
MTADLQGMVAVVTGSSSGIGEAVARHLSLTGANLVVNSSTSVAEGQRVAAALPTDSIYIQADVSDQHQCQGLVEQALNRFGRLDILVNNAGWTTQVDHADLEGLTDEIFMKTFQVNVFGTWWVTKAAMPHLRNAPDGSVTMVTSVAGIRPVGSSIAYAMSKAALNHMTVLLAKSYGPVRVNAVAPGLIDTPWTADWEAARQMVTATAPLGRTGTPDDVAAAVLGLVTNPYVSGEVLVVDGELTQSI